MSYIGNQPPDIGAYDVESFDGGGTSFTLKKAATTPSVLLFIDGVRQTPTDAYSVSGVTLTTTATTPSGTDNVTVMFMGDVVDIGAPSDDTVSTAKIQDDAVTTDKILDDAVTADKLANSINTEIAANTAKVTNATHTGDVTGATALTIAVDAVDIAMLSATGTASASTFLRGDNAWAEAGGDNSAAFFAYATANQTLSSDTNTKLVLNAEAYDSDSAFDKDTNYRFTVPTGKGGKYLVYAAVDCKATTLTEVNGGVAMIYLNGSEVQASLHGIQYPQANPAYDVQATVTGVMVLAEDDYIELWGNVAVASGTPTVRGDTGRTRTYMGAHRLIGV